jgi:phosphoribosyl 1,2-cyclic phosphodiesterase
MIIKCWGARGSIPVSGQEYLKYGGSTTCIEVRTKDDEIIIIDAGSGIRKLGNKLLSENRHEYNMIVTHSHWDHILGFPFFKPIYVEGTHLDMFGCPYLQESVREMVSRTMVHPNFPVDFTNVKSEISFHGACEGSFRLKSVTVTPIYLSHPGQGMGYKFVEDEKCFVLLTDNELTFKHPGGLDYQDYLDFAYEADLLIHDSELTKEEYKTMKAWGHTVYTDALKLALEAKVGSLGLFHHNQERTDVAIDGIVQHCKQIISNSNVGLECFAVYEGMEIRL